MTLVDTNILIYATFKDAPEHAIVRRWLEGRLADRESMLALCWPVVYAFIRLVSSPRVMGPHSITVGDGWALAARYLAQPAVRIIIPGGGHASIALELAQTPGLRSEDVPDVEIAALAIEHGLILASHDRGFRRFTGLRVFDPLG